MTLDISRLPLPTVFIGSQTQRIVSINESSVLFIRKTKFINELTFRGNVTDGSLSGVGVVSVETSDDPIDDSDVVAVAGP